MTTKAETLIESVKAAGGILKLEAGGSVKCFLSKEALYLVPDLAAHKPEVIALLKAKGGRAANFPRCPVCGSYALFREHNVGAYECQTCCQQDIAEDDARRTDASTRRRGNEVIR